MVPVSGGATGEPDLLARKGRLTLLCSAPLTQEPPGRSSIFNRHLYLQGHPAVIDITHPCDNRCRPGGGKVNVGTLGWISLGLWQPLAA